MRYKFKAWDSHHKIWRDRVLAGCDSDGTDYVCNLVWMDEIDDWTNFDEGCGTIVQYTGLKDRNGVEIYEGDVGQRDETIYVIRWDAQHARYSAEVIKTNYVLTRGLAFPLWQYIEHGECVIEIIGNRFEHPHLLPKGEEQT